MNGNPPRLRAFLDCFQGREWKGTCKQYCQPDFEIHEPPALRLDGAHRGVLVPIDVSEIHRSIWDAEIGDQHVWEAENEDLVVSRYVMTSTSKDAGRSMPQPVVELNLPRGQALPIEVYMSNQQALMATLDKGQD